MSEQSFKSMEDAALLSHRAGLLKSQVINRFARMNGMLQNVQVLRNIRRDIARVNTELRVREISRNLEKGSLSGQMPARSDEGGARQRHSRFGLGKLNGALLQMDTNKA